jgi:hypothetical protein
MRSGVVMGFLDRFKPKNIRLVPAESESLEKIANELAKIREILEYFKKQGFQVIKLP